MAIDPTTFFFFVVPQDILISAQIFSSNAWNIWSN